MFVETDRSPLDKHATVLLTTSLLMGHCEHTKTSLYYISTLPLIYFSSATVLKSGSAGEYSKRLHASGRPGRPGRRRARPRARHRPQRRQQPVSTASLFLLVEQIQTNAQLLLLCCEVSFYKLINWVFFFSFMSFEQIFYLL